MFFSKVTAVASLMALFNVINAAAIIQQRSTPQDLYAYGTGISGVQLYIGNDLAWLGNPEPSDIPRISNLTFIMNNNETLAAASPQGKWLADENPLMFINPNSFAQVGFRFSNDTTTSNETTTGFKWFGSDLTWVNDGLVQESFWATETNVTGLWKLRWNSDSATFTEGTPVTLRTVGLGKD